MLGVLWTGRRHACSSHLIFWHASILLVHKVGAHLLLTDRWIHFERVDTGENVRASKSCMFTFEMPTGWRFMTFSATICF